MNVFITGNRGQLGQALTRCLASEHTVSGGDLPDWDMLNGDQVVASFEAAEPEVVIHTAALTNVDYCATHPAEAVRINAGGATEVALAARQVGARLIAISTNEVFPGDEERFYQEYDDRRAINPYGYSKLVAERAIERILPSAMVVRTAWLFGAGGGNFIHKILARARSGDPLRVVTDEVGSPTAVDDLAEALAQLVSHDRPGNYHFVNSGVCSRYEFAEEIVRAAGLTVPITPITSDAFERASTPPPYAPLANVFGAMAGITLPSWQEAVQTFIERYGDTPGE